MKKHGSSIRSRTIVPRATVIASNPCSQETYRPPTPWLLSAVISRWKEKEKAARSRSHAAKKGQKRRGGRTGASFAIKSTRERSFLRAPNDGRAGSKWAGLRASSFVSVTKSKSHNDDIHVRFHLFRLRTRWRVFLFVSNKQTCRSCLLFWTRYCENDYTLLF